MILQRVRSKFDAKLSDLTRHLYFLRTGLKVDGERVNPDFPDQNFANHFRAYQFLQQFARGVDAVDIGCGTGYGTHHLAQVARSIVGVDISSSSIAWAKKRYPRIDYRVMDVQQLAFADESFDLIVSSENFEHLPDQRTHLRELARVLRPKGLCIIATPNPEMFVGVENPHHVKENSYDELVTLFPERFATLQILENSLEPSEPVGLKLRQDRWREGRKGLTTLPDVDLTFLSNTHSFFCFAQGPRKG